MPLTITDTPTNAIRPYPSNPRMNKGAVDAVARSIEAFGFRQPIVVDGEGVIIVGHTRWKAAKQLKLKTVPVHVADMDAVSAKAYRIADNQTSNLADWDEELLPFELADLQAAEFDMELLGFGEDELIERLGGSPAFEPTDEPPPRLDEKSPVTCPECGHEFTP